MRPSFPSLRLSLLFLFGPSLAHADTAGVPSMGSSLLQLAIGFLFILGLLFATLWALKRLSAPRGGGSGLLAVRSATAVGPRERVVVVEIGDTWLVLGVAPGRVTRLHELPRQTVAPAAETGADFPLWLKSVLDRKHAPR